MNTIIEIYIYVCIMLLLFNIVFLIIKSLKTRKFYPQNNKLKKMIEKELDKYNPKEGLASEIKEFLKDKTSKTKNLMLIQKELENPRNYRKELQAEIRPYILNQITNYQKKNDYDQAYYAYVVSYFDYDELRMGEEVYSKFLSFLDSKSLYVFSNSMDAIYKFSDSYIMSVAIKKADERGGFYHSKLLVDGLLKFKGDADKLQELIIDKFYEYSALTQDSLLKYFRLKGSNVHKLCLEIIEERKVEDEVLYNAMRYFEKKPDEKAKDIFIELLKNESSFWVEELLAIQALNHYDEAEIKSIIKRKITSRNWHVRTNAIAYIHDHMVNKEEILDIVSIEDKCTNETLLYYYKDDEETSKYIINNMKKMDLEPNEGQEPKPVLCIENSG